MFRRMRRAGRREFRQFSVNRRATFEELAQNELASANESASSSDIGGRAEGAFALRRNTRKTELRWRENSRVPLIFGGPATGPVALLRVAPHGEVNGIIILVGPLRKLYRQW